MKRVFFLCACLFTLQAFAQDTTKIKQKEYLGVLTLTEKYKVEKNWTEKDQSIVGEHFQRLMKYKKEGIVVLAGRTELPLNDSNMMGLVIFYAKNDSEAMQFMQNDPAVKNKIMLAKALPYSIALH